MLHKNDWLYALACVFVPILWGLAMVWLIEKLENTRLGSWLPKHSSADRSEPTIEYHI